MTRFEAKDCASAKGSNASDSRTVDSVRADRPGRNGSINLVHSRKYSVANKILSPAVSTLSDDRISFLRRSLLLPLASTSSTISSRSVLQKYRASIYQTCRENSERSAKPIKAGTPNFREIELRGNSIAPNLRYGDNI